MNNKEFIERKTKILATLGPSSNTIKKIIELSKAGANALCNNTPTLIASSPAFKTPSIRLSAKNINPSDCTTIKDPIINKVILGFI